MSAAEPEPATKDESDAAPSGAVARIQSVEIENLRGIRSGKLEGLAPLTVLTGPNGSGKSTVLDALDIGGSPNPAEAVRDCIRRRVSVPRGEQWLFRDGREKSARVACSGGGGVVRDVQLVKDVQTFRSPTRMRGEEDRWQEITAVTAEISQSPEIEPDGDGDEKNFSINFPEDRGPLFRRDRRKPGFPFGEVGEVVWVQGLATGELKPRPAHDLYSAARVAGHGHLADQAAQQLFPGVERLDVLSDADKPYLVLSWGDHVVPAQHGGDGAYAVLRIALELIAVVHGVVLLEEPEAHLHPAAMALVAKAIVHAVRAGTQVVLTTHSLEFLDCLLDECEDEEELISLFKVSLKDGHLRHGRFVGRDVFFARDEIAQDLR